MWNILIFVNLKEEQKTATNLSAPNTLYAVETPRTLMQTNFSTTQSPSRKKVLPTHKLLVKIFALSVIHRHLHKLVYFELFKQKQKIPPKFSHSLSLNSMPVCQSVRLPAFHIRANTAEKVPSRYFQKFPNAPTHFPAHLTLFEYICMSAYTIQAWTHIHLLYVYVCIRIIESIVHTFVLYVVDENLSNKKRKTVYFH